VRVYGLWFMFQGLSALDLRIWFRVEGLVFGVWCLVFSIEGLGRSKLTVREALDLFFDIRSIPAIDPNFCFKIWSFQRL